MNTEKPYNFVEMLSKQKRSGINPPLCFFTDVDFTLIYQDASRQSQLGYVQAATEQNKRYQAATFDFFDLLKSYNIPIIPVSGIDLPILKAYQKNAILPNDIDIALLSVGTEIWLRQNVGNYILDDEFKKYIEYDIGFKRHDIYPICERFRDFVCQQYYPDIGLEFQPRDRKSSIMVQDSIIPYNATEPQRYKISLSFVGDKSVAVILENLFLQLLYEEGYPNIRVLFSHDKYLESGKIRFNIDILPVTKGDSIKYLTSVYDCVPIYAGDSGNDIGAIKSAADIAIIVGNARTDLLDEITTWNGIGGDLLRKYEVNERIIRIYRDEDSTSRGPESLIKASQELLRLFTRYQRFKNCKDA